MVFAVYGWDDGLGGPLLALITLTTDAAPHPSIVWLYDNVHNYLCEGSSMDES